MDQELNEVSLYVQKLPPDRKQIIEVIRALIRETVPEAQESMRYRLPTYEIGGNFLAAVASQKHYISLYLNSQVLETHRQELSHLNCGKGCVRFKLLEDLPVEVVKAILIETHEAA